MDGEFHEANAIGESCRCIGTASSKAAAACKTPVRCSRPVARCELCQQFNVSPNTAYKLLRRFRAVGEQSLQDRSRRPLHSPSETLEHAGLLRHTRRQQFAAQALKNQRLAVDFENLPDLGRFFCIAGQRVGDNPSVLAA